MFINYLEINKTLSTLAELLKMRFSYEVNYIAK